MTLPIATMTATTIASMQSAMPRRTTTLKESHIPNIRYSPPTTGLTSFEAISIRVGLIAKKSSTVTQDTPNKKSQASNGHPSLSGSKGRPLSRSRSIQGITRHRGWDSDGKRDARAPRNTEHTRQANFRQTTNAWNHDSVISKHGYNSYTQ
jgi:hypothetical protein